MQVDRPIAAAIILFIILLLVFFLVTPEYKTFKKLQSELGEKKAEFNAEFDYYAEITAIEIVPGVVTFIEAMAQLAAIKIDFRV